MGHLPRLSRVRQLTAVEAAWVGAMIEAEGCVYVRPPRGRSRAFMISVTNTDVEIVATMLRLVGDGSVVLHHQTPAPQKPQWIWSLSAWNALRDLAPQIAPYMTAKGEKLVALLP